MANTIPPNGVLKKAAASPAASAGYCNDHVFFGDLGPPFGQQLIGDLVNGCGDLDGGALPPYCAATDCHYQAGYHFDQYDPEPQKFVYNFTGARR